MEQENEMKSVIDLHIDGMSCGHCVRAVKEALLRGPGVFEAEVDLETGNARVWHSGLATVASLQAEVENEGYSASER